MELIFAGKEMLSVTTKQKLNQLKAFLFSLSMCEYEKDFDSFDMWQLYGDNGYGIGIVFSFYPNIDSWNNCFLSSVYYGNDNKTLEKFEKFSEDHIKFMNDNLSLRMQSNVIGESEISDSIALFLAFHKNSIYTIENEVRFLKSFLTGYEEFSEINESIEIKLNKKKELHYAYKVPIVSEKNINTLPSNDLSKIKNFQNEFIADRNIIDKYVGKDPFIVIEKVILGYKHNENDFKKIKKSETVINRKLRSYLFSFELSHLSKEFHGA